MKLNKFIVLIFCFAATLRIQAQKVTTEGHSQKVNGDTAEGYATTLEAKKEEVSIAWNKFLKDFGKPKVGSGVTIISEPALGGTAYQQGVIYADLKAKGESTEVWLGIKEGEWTVNDIGIVKKDLEKEVYRFGIKFYKDKIQAQIDEAQRAYDATTRQSQRLVNQNKDLNIQLGNNEQEKLKLEERLEGNKLEHAVLLQKIENNKLAQDSVAQASEQIKKVIELHKDRQRKVN
ncbi:MAG TPA: hypothetical protein P5280_06135 [Cyclobacteriaceae bacterium]|nr:hypothetical protein [Cyclobacteriaceae bacterium]